MDIVPIEPQALRDSDILNPDYNFDDKITVATKVATSLKKVIDDQGLAVQIGKKPNGEANLYVTAEGWEVLGTMLGCTPFVEEVVEIPSDRKGHYIYKATVSIRHNDTVLARAEAIAERNQKQRERPFVYSMAQTRALGKAYRMALSWIIRMAGYEPTPAEEMPRFKPNHVVEAEVMEKVKLPKKQKEEEPEEELEMYKIETPFFGTADELPLIESFIKSIIAEIHNDGLHVTKHEIVKRSYKSMKEKEISIKEHKEVISWCKAHCPEEIEDMGEEL